MPDSDKFHATRLFALALKARESGFTAAWKADLAIVAVVLTSTIFTAYLIYGLLFL